MSTINVEHVMFRRFEVLKLAVLNYKKMVTDEKMIQDYIDWFYNQFSKE